MKKWPGDAQPEWPKVASPTQQVPAVARETQVFPESGTGADRARENTDAVVTDADETDVLEAAHGARRRPFGNTGKIPTPARPPAEETRALRDPWGGTGESDHAFDPHEVTVQLDGVSQQLDSRSAEPGGPAGPGAQDGSDGPVFVDESGRRSRRFRRIGIALGIACAVYAVVIVATLLSGSSDAPWLPVPGQKDDTPAGKVDDTPQPSPSVLPSGTGAGEAGATPGASDGTTQDVTAGATAPGSAASGTSGTSADPKPSTTTTTKGSTSTTGGGTSTTTGGTGTTGGSAGTTGSTTTGTTGSTTTGTTGSTTTGGDTTGTTGSTTTGGDTTGTTGSTTTGSDTTGDTGTTTDGGTTAGDAASLRTGAGQTRSAVAPHTAPQGPAGESGTSVAPTYT